MTNFPLFSDEVDRPNHEYCKYEKMHDPMGDPLNLKTKEWISIEYIESEMEKIFEDLKDFQYWE